MNPLLPAAPVNYGFLIDNRLCIGCHACSTACKSENEVPLGVYRTWVKTTETGQFPDTQRHFQVTRCNHCANPPCVRICPTQAMVQRTDGIVEFDGDACIGCKACLQACPYDAIHIDPETGTAAKCHFCSHRTDLGLEPACVVVCPEHAILAGNLADPQSEISRVLSREKVVVRKPEQGTAPKLFYIEGTAQNLHPTAGARAPATFAATDVLSLVDGRVRFGPDLDPVPAPHGGLQPGHSYEALRRPQHQGLPDAGPLIFGGTRAEHMVQVGYNAQHRVPWHWPVAAYLVTKGLGSGVLLLLAGAVLAGLTVPSSVAAAGTLWGLLMLGATTGLLVYDLERPERFLTILTRPNWSSWLVRGAVFLLGLTVVSGAWFVGEAGAALQLIDAVPNLVRTGLTLLTLPFAVGAAIYTAFLFGQAEGRDLWQSPLLPFHLLLQAATMGAASLLLLDPLLHLGPDLLVPTRLIFGGGLLLDGFVTLAGDLGMPHASEVAARAADSLRRGRWARHFWGGGMVLGKLAPLLLLLIPSPLAAALAAVCAIAGLALYEHAFVMAPQEIPNS